MPLFESRWNANYAAVNELLANSNSMDAHFSLDTSMTFNPHEADSSFIIADIHRRASLAARLACEQRSEGLRPEIFAKEHLNKIHTLLYALDPDTRMRTVATVRSVLNGAIISAFEMKSSSTDIVETYAQQLWLFDGERTPGFGGFIAESRNEQLLELAFLRGWFTCQHFVARSNVSGSLSGFYQVVSTPVEVDRIRPAGLMTMHERRLMPDPNVRCWSVKDFGPEDRKLFNDGRPLLAIGSIAGPGERGSYLKEKLQRGVGPVDLSERLFADLVNQLAHQTTIDENDTRGSWHASFADVQTFNMWMMVVASGLLDLWTDPKDEHYAHHMALLENPVLRVHELIKRQFANSSMVKVSKWFVYAEGADISNHFHDDAPIASNYKADEMLCRWPKIQREHAWPQRWVDTLADPCRVATEELAPVSDDGHDSEPENTLPSDPADAPTTGLSAARDTTGGSTKRRSPDSEATRESSSQSDCSRRPVKRGRVSERELAELLDFSATFIPRPSSH